MADSRRTRETRIIEVQVTGKSDLPIPGTDITITPRTVELTFRWPAGATSVEVRGPRRGRTPGWTTARMLPGDPWPDWLTELVDQHRPDGWPTN
jgi:hypothetical protein